MPMFRPPPEWQYKNSLARYETKFRRKTPQWVLTLGPEETRQLIGVALRLGWKLAPKILVGGEEHSGRESLWAQQQTRLDYETERKNRGRFEPRDLQDLPFDPAEAVARFLDSQATRQREGMGQVSHRVSPNRYQNAPGSEARGAGSFILRLGKFAQAVQSLPFPKAHPLQPQTFLAARALA